MCRKNYEQLIRQLMHLDLDVAMLGTFVVFSSISLPVKLLYLGIEFICDYLPCRILDEYVEANKSIGRLRQSEYNLYQNKYFMSSHRYWIHTMI